jgi:hypothetical protein
MRTRLSERDGAGMTITSLTEQGSRVEQVRHEAHLWIRRKRILYTILGVYAVLSLMWFTIDMSDGSESLWFYWPMFGAGIAVAVAAVVLLGVGGVFGTAWEQRQVALYVERHGAIGEPMPPATRRGPSRSMIPARCSD